MNATLPISHFKRREKWSECEKNRVVLYSGVAASCFPAVFLILKKYPIKDMGIHTPQWFCHTKLLLRRFHRQPQAHQRQPCSSGAAVLWYFVLAVTHRAQTHYFSSHAKSTGMNVHTCCCFLCLPCCCWNMNDSKAVRRIFHEARSFSQNQSIKCHLSRRVTYGEVNAVLLCNHFYLEITLQ